MAPPSEHPKRHPDSSFRPIGDEGGLVVLPGKAEVKVLNPAAITIFGLLDGEHSPDQIVERITSEFDVSAEVARADLDSFLKELATQGMLESEG